jgi:hypothetical protein
MSQYRRLFIAIALFLSGVALIPYVSLSSEQFGWQLFADAYEPDQPSLVINHQTGQPGSFFILTGSDFPSDDTATITVNGQTLGTVPTDGAGGLVFVLDTTGADPGLYSVTASVNPSASTSFQLDPDAPLRPGEGTAGLPLLNVPSGIAFTRLIYLPVILR